MKVFVTGASGYLGGSISQRLLEHGHEVLGLVRNAENAALLKQRGIKPLLGSLDDAASLSKGALHCDATINAANSDHYFAAQTLISAMKDSGKTLIHTSGSSIICDDAKGETSIDKVFDETTPFTPMLHRAPRIQIDRLVRTAGVESGIRALVICPSMVYGRGLGLHLDSDQLPKLINKSRELQAGVYIGAGAPIWSNIHISDLADLYVAALERATSGAIFYSENGEASFKEIAAAVSDALGFGGKVISWPFEKAFAELGGFAQVALATNARIRAVNARQGLGWKPHGPSLADALRDEL